MCLCQQQQCGKYGPPLGTFWNSSLRSAVRLCQQAGHRLTPWEEGCAVCLVSKATLPKNFAITKCVNFWQHCKVSVDKIVNDGILQAQWIRQCQCQEDACMCVGIEGQQGGGARRERKSRNSAQTHRQIRITAMTTQTQCAYLYAQ